MTENKKSADEIADLIIKAGHTANYLDCRISTQHGAVVFEMIKALEKMAHKEAEMSAKVEELKREVKITEEIVFSTDKVIRRVLDQRDDWHDKNDMLVKVIEDTVEYLEKTDKPLTLVEISILNTLKQALSNLQKGEGEA